MRCLYSSSLPVFASRTEPAKSVRNVSGYCLRDAFRLIGTLPDAPTALKSLFCCSDRGLCLIFWGCANGTSLSIMFGPFFDPGVPVLHIFTVILWNTCCNYILWFDSVTGDGWLKVFFPSKSEFVTASISTVSALAKFVAAFSICCR